MAIVSYDISVSISIIYFLPILSLVEVAENLKVWGNAVQNIFEKLKLFEFDAEVLQNDLSEIQSKAKDISEFLSDLVQTNERSAKIEDLIEDELSSMDKNIEDAAEQIETMINQSIATDSGLKLEVNEQILDACTQLMKSIKTLVKKSRILQDEIISTGKGNSTIKEFYKRNHQWTEGMISAAKNVARGATFLV